MLFSLAFAYYQKAACATDTPICSDVCVSILKAGGNAVDAVVAATICVGTVSSQASGIGGGGFAVLDIKGKRHFVNFREMAPLAANKDMFTNPLDAQKGPKSIATPGELKGLFEMHSKYGKLQWADLLRPSIQLAQDGFKITAHLAKSLKSGSAGILSDPGLSAVYSKIVNGEKVVVEENDIVHRKNLATTLQYIAEFGITEFYSGSIAKTMVNYIQSKGGILSLQDLNRYKVEWNTPLHVKYREYDVYTGLAPSGGPVLAMMLKVAEQFQFPGNKDNVTDMHRLVEIMKHAYAKRSQLADPNFISNVTTLTNRIKTKRFAMEVYTRINDAQTYGPEHYNSSYEFFQDAGTTHLSVLDEQGNSASLTSTVNLGFGSGIMDPITGIIFNDQMDDFSLPNQKNAFDLAPSAVNFIDPLKRPQSSSAPTIIKYLGLPVMVIGGSGGSRITSAVFKTIIDTLDQKIPINDSIQSSRVHHQLFPNSIEVEDDLPSDYVNGLKQKGHGLKSDKMTFSAVQGVHVRNGLIYAASDKRKHGQSSGY